MLSLPLETRRLRLREYRAEDEHDVHAFASDPAVTAHTTWGPNDEQTTHTALCDWLEQQDKWPREAIPLAIEHDGQVIGSTGFSSVDPNTLTGEFGFALHRDHWGKGLATEAVYALLHFGFRTLGLHRVVAECFERSAGARRVLEKVGMRCEGTQRQSVQKAGDWQDSCTYAMLCAEWAPSAEFLQAVPLAVAAPDQDSTAA